MQGRFNLWRIVAFGRDQGLDLVWRGTHQTAQLGRIDMLVAAPAH